MFDVSCRATELCRIFTLSERVVWNISSRVKELCGMLFRRCAVFEVCLCVIACVRMCACAGGCNMKCLES